MTFGAPSFLPWLLLVVVLAWLLWLYRRWQQRTLQTWASPRFLKTWGLLKPWWYRVIGDAALCLGVAAMLLALARPQWGWTKGRATQRGMEIVVVLDVSASMYLSDMRPTRWHRAVFALHAFAQQLSGDRMALVAVDGEAGLQSPFTDDVTALRELAWYSRPGLFPAQGPGLASALALANKQLQSRKQMHDARAVIVLTDGDPLRTSAAMLEAKRLKRQGILLFVVGVGGQKAPSNQAKLPSTETTLPWLKNKQKRSLPPWQPLPTASLQQIAQAGQGSYSSLTSMGSGLFQVRQALSKLQRSERSQRQQKKPIERYPFALGLALICLMFHRILQV